LLSLLDALPEDSPFVQLDPPQRRQRTLDGLKRILLRESQVQPLVLVCEDLHWIDSETQALLDSLVESLPTARLLLLVTYRPEYRHGWGSKTYYTQLRLDPFHADSAEAFLHALLGDDPSLAALKQLLIERTEGNPFFLEESVRTLVEMQVLVGTSGAYCLTQDIPTIQVPSTVQAVLAARIDRLPPDEKHLLQTAAVIGTEVPLTLLQAIAEMPKEALHRGLTHLQAAEFLYETSLFPERVYTFKHALTHEVAYESLLHERRRVLHARIVDALETLVGDRVAEQVERLAHHALRGEVWDKALLYFRQAGKKALASSVYWEAGGCFEQALFALQHLPENRAAMEQAIDLRLNLHGALSPLREYERLLDHLHAAAQLAETLNDQRRLGWVSSFCAHSLWSIGKQDRAIEVSHRTLDLATTLGDVDLLARTHLTLGQAYLALGTYRQAMQFLAKNVACLETGPMAVFSRVWLVWCLAECGAFAEGITYGEEAIRIAEAVNQPWSMTHAYFGMGFLCLRTGDLSQAISLLERGFMLCCTVDIPAAFFVTAAHLGYAYALRGRLAEALSLLERAELLEQAEQKKSIGAGLSLWMAWHSEAYLLAGRMDDALTLAQRALDLSRARKEQGRLAWTLRLLGDIHGHHDPPDIDQAEAYYQQALSIANDLGMRPLQAHCHRGLGTLYSQAGQSEQARAELSTAIELYRDMEMTFWLPQTEASLAEVEKR
jgi:tetratricopeptide (TPR) repeat protein